MTEPQDRDHKIAIITMIRRSEFPAAWSCLATLDPQLSSSVTHFLLLNDDRDPALEQRLSLRSFTTVITPGTNLGVAKGRNQLIEAALDWGADLVLSLDDDLLVPSDYVERLSAAITDLSGAGERIGVVAPVVVDFHALASATMSQEQIAAAETGGLETFATTEQLRAQIRAAWPEDIPVEAIYHAGLRDWRNHYLDSFRGRASRVRTLYGNARGQQDAAKPLTEMRLHQPTRQAVISGSSDPISVHTVAGGACAYTADLLRAIGGLDEAFSPFGYEDSDFGIRAMHAGFKNYVIPNEVLLHDLDSRQKERSSAILLYTQGRARALIGRKHLPGKERARGLIEIACLAPLQAMELSRAVAGRMPSIAGEIVGSSVAYFAGFIEGLFAEIAEPQYDPDRTAPQHHVLPPHLDRSTRFELRSWPDSPHAGLPSSMMVDATVAYSWDVTAARFTLHQLVLDAPGLIRISLKGQLEGVGQRDQRGNPDPLQTTIAGLELEVEDWGFLRRFETSVAWFRRERSAGYLGALFPYPERRTGRAIKWFLSLRQEPARFQLIVQPPTPVTVEELYAQTPGVNQDRRLGLTAMVNQTVRY